MVNMLGALTEQVDNMQKHLDNISMQIKTLKTHGNAIIKKKMEIKNVFDGLISRLSREESSGNEDMSIRTSQIEKLKGHFFFDREKMVKSKRMCAQLLSHVFCSPMDCSPPGSSVHGIPQARILEWVAILFSRGSP